METLKRTPKTEQFTLGFIGLGWIGRSRMEKLLTHSKVKGVGIVEPFKEHAESALQLDEEMQVFDSAEAMIADPQIQGIVIATPSAMHAEQATLALMAGKAVFCQKPLGRTFDEVQKVLKASAQTNKLLAVDFSYRYTKAFKAVYDVVQSGELGQIFAVDLVFHNAYGPDKAWFYDLNQSGGGCVLDLGIHLLDMALWSLQYPQIQEVRSQLYSGGKKLGTNPKKVEDYASVALSTKDGVAINLQCSWHISAGREAVIEAKFYGTQGGAAFTNINGSFYDFKAEKYKGTQTEPLVLPPDDWGGRAGMVWADAVMDGAGYDAVSAQELLQLAELIDTIYGR